jgi:transcriptional regulator with XRE-family HTH domain
MGRILFVFKDERALTRLGPFFKKLRQNKFAMLKDMCESTGIAQSHLSFMESEKGPAWNPKLKTLIRHAAGLDCELVLRKKGPAEKEDKG